jgi:hypothetical protein
VSHPLNSPTVPAWSAHRATQPHATGPPRLRTAPPSPSGRSLLRPDGAVTIPAALAGEVVRILAAHLDARVRADGGELSPGTRRLLDE